MHPRLSLNTSAWWFSILCNGSHNWAITKVNARYDNQEQRLCIYIVKVEGPDLMGRDCLDHFTVTLERLTILPSHGNHYIVCSTTIRMVYFQCVLHCVNLWYWM